MANPPSVTELREYHDVLTHTLPEITPRITDQVFNHYPLVGVLTGRLGSDMFGRVQGQGKGRRSAVGESIETRVTLGKSNNAKAMNGHMDMFGQNFTNPSRTGRSNWKQYGATILISGHDMRNNRGTAKIADLLQTRTMTEISTLVELIGTHLYDQGSVAKNLTGLTQVVSANDTIQNLPGASSPYWNSRGLSPKGTAPASISFTGGPFSTTGLSNWRMAWLNASEGGVQPDATFTSDLIHTYYEATLAPEVRFTSTVSADLGIITLAFKAKPVFNDPLCPSGTSWQLNFDHLEWVYNDAADFTVTPQTDQNFQDVFSSKILVECQLCTNGRKFQNKVTGITA